MAKLKRKHVVKASSLLTEFDAVNDALARVSKMRFDFGITVTNEENDSDFLSVGLDRKLAETALAAQRRELKRQLTKLGIKVGRT